MLCTMVVSVLQKPSWQRFRCLTQTWASCVKTEARVHAVRYCCITLIMTPAYTTPNDWEWKTKPVTLCLGLTTEFQYEKLTRRAFMAVWVSTQYVHASISLWCSYEICGIKMLREIVNSLE